MAVYFTLLDSVRCPGVVEAPTFESQLARATPFGNDWSIKVSLVLRLSICPVPLLGSLGSLYQVATFPKVEG